MDIRHMVAAQRQLDEAVAAIESSKNKRLTPAARVMLEALLLEAVTTREGEWPERAGVTFSAYGSEVLVAARVRESLNVLLQESYIKQTGDFITTRDIMLAAQSKWCGIFPFC